MRPTPEVAHDANFDRYPARIISGLKESGTSQTDPPRARSLLVGRDTSWGIALLRSLIKFGSEFSFVPPLRVTAEFVRKGAYTLILIDSTVPMGQRKQLVCGLVGSDASIFYAYPVENGCWWVPVLLSGEDCYGSPAFRTEQLLVELGHILGEGNDLTETLVADSPAK
jgi:hypothetical protein